MNITEYLLQINSKCQSIFDKTILNSEPFGKAHHLSSCLFEFSEHILDCHEKEMLATVSAQLEASFLNLSLGLYRQSFSSLRLAFEMGLGVVYFSIYKMEHYEWLAGSMDIKWSKLISKENGVISKRFASAFFPELGDLMDLYNRPYHE